MISSSKPREIEPSSASVTFLGGDQGWIDLKLTDVDIVNHNTKKFRFALNSDNDVSGLKVACEFDLLIGCLTVLMPFQ